MRVAEIFSSISGEVGTAILQGEPCTFVRFFGCPVACDYCDTPESWYEGGVFSSNFSNMAKEEIVAEILNIGNKKVIVTGGEPVIQSEFEEFLDLLWETREIENVVVETSGIPVPFDIRKRNDFKIRWAVDYKLPSAKSKYPNLNKFDFCSLWFVDMVKFLIFTRKDLIEAIEKCKEISEFVPEVPVFVFAPANPEFTRLIITTAKEAGIDIVINVQIHKILNIA